MSESSSRLSSFNDKQDKNRRSSNSNCTDQKKNSPRSLTSGQNKNRSSTEFSLSDQYKNTLENLNDKFSKSSSKTEKQKGEAINNAIQVMEKHSQEKNTLNNRIKVLTDENIRLKDVTKNIGETVNRPDKLFLENDGVKNETGLLNRENDRLENENDLLKCENDKLKNEKNEEIKELEQKLNEVNKEISKWKAIMEKSTEEYAVNIKKKNDELTELKQKLNEANKEISELKAKQIPVAYTCSGGNQSIYNDSKLNKVGETQLSEKDEKIKQLKDKIRILEDNYEGLTAVNIVLNDEISKLQVEITELKTEITRLNGNDIEITTAVTESLR